MLNFLRNCQIIFHSSRSISHFYNERGSRFSTSSPTLVIFCFLFRYLFLCLHRVLVVACGIFVVARRLSSCTDVRSSQTRDRTCVSCPGMSAVASVMSFSATPRDCSPPGSSVQGDSPGKSTGVGCHALLQGSFLTQGSNPHL